MGLLQRVKRAVNNSLISRLQKRFPNDYMKVFSNLYDEMLVRPFNFNSDDRTAPIYIKDEVMRYVEQSIRESLNSLDPNGPIIIDAVPHDVIYTRPSRSDTDGVKLFYFYLVGTPGKFVVLRNTDYERIFPYLKGTGFGIGRFGNMHMLPYERYQYMYSRVPSNFTRRWPHPDSIVHPFSGAPPIRIFEAANDAVVPILRKYLSVDVHIGVA